MCESCAFRRTCDTWQEPNNRLVSQICAAGPLPFHCHQGIDWRDPLTALLPARVLAREGMRPCEGWKRAVAARRWPTGESLRWYQRMLAKAALITADRFLAGAATTRELQRDLTPLAEFYKGPRAWQLARMTQRNKRKEEACTSNY
jgi:hypothetical protein